MKTLKINSHHQFSADTTLAEKPEKVKCSSAFKCIEATT